MINAVSINTDTTTYLQVYIPVSDRLTWLVTGDDWSCWSAAISCEVYARHLSAQYVLRRQQLCNSAQTAAALQEPSGQLPRHTCLSSFFTYRRACSNDFATEHWAMCIQTDSQSPSRHQWGYADDNPRCAQSLSVCVTQRTGLKAVFHSSQRFWTWIWMIHGCCCTSYRKIDLVNVSSVSPQCAVLPFAR